MKEPKKYKIEILIVTPNGKHYGRKFEYEEETVKHMPKYLWISKSLTQGSKELKEAIEKVGA